jgi:hypothetical protein
MNSASYYEQRRKRIFEMYAAGMRYVDIGKHFGISGTRAREIRIDWLKKHGLTYACPGHVVTVLTVTEWGLVQETGQFVWYDDDGESTTHATIWDKVDGRRYSGLILEILEKDEDGYYWQHPMLPGRKPS